MADEPQFLPPDDEITLADELAGVEALLTPSDLEIGAPPDAPAPLGRGWAFDFTTNQFRRGGSRPAGVSGYDELTVWIEKCLRTARGAHPIYSADFGVDQPFSMIGQPFNAAAAGRYGQSVKQALLAHDRITDVTDFTFTGDESSGVLAVSFRVVTDEDDVLSIDNLPLGG